MKVTLAASQRSCSKNYDENIKKATELIRLAKKKNADRILLQELFERNYFCQIEDYNRFSFAEEYDHSPTLEYFSKLAKELEIVLPISFFEKKGNCYYNSLCVIDKDGSRKGLYRKTHIPTGECYEEKFYFTPGDTGFKVFDTKAGRIGIGICWDQWFPEAARCMAVQGAEMLLYPTAIGSEPILDVDSSSHWRRVMQGHAAANLMPVVAANRIGVETVGPCKKNAGQSSSLDFYGCSFIADATGDIIASAKQEETILYGEFDLDALKEDRLSWGLFRDRRPETYVIMTKK